jgi:XTP/dITP diphosphohydrolase
VGDVTVVLATRNAHKAAELDAMLRPAGVRCESLAGRDDVPDVVEDGDTFEANARKKAREVCRATGHPALADDSGLEVDALGGGPGVRSARYAADDDTAGDGDGAAADGAAAADAANRAKLRERLRGVPAGKRSARFVCVLALALPGGHEFVVAGECRGTVRDEERGTNGFGYDPLFVPDGHTRTFAEMTAGEKAELSHRGRAMAAARRPMARLLREWAAKQGRGAGAEGRLS